MDSNTSIYLGKECEGWLDLGKQTIFIPRGVTSFIGISAVYEKIKQLECNRIYFGAKSRRGLDEEDIGLINLLYMDRKIKYQILVEINDFSWLQFFPKDLCTKIEFIFVAETKNAIPISHFKIESEDQVHWYVLKRVPSVTYLNDKEYENDKEIQL